MGFNSLIFHILESVHRTITSAKNIFERTTSLPKFDVYKLKKYIYNLAVGHNSINVL